MSPIINDGVANPLSRITIASLDELGYSVDYTEAEPYTAADLASTCDCTSRRHRLGEREGASRRQLRTGAQAAAHLAAFQYGRKCLMNAKDAPEGVVTETDWISVLYRDPESDNFVTVIVTEADLY